MSSTAPSSTRLVLLPSASIVVALSHSPVVRLFPVQPVRWIDAARPVFRWLEHPIRCTARIVKFAAICVALYALLVLVML